MGEKVVAGQFDLSDRNRYRDVNHRIGGRTGISPGALNLPVTISR